MFSVRSFVAAAALTLCAAIIYSACRVDEPVVDIPGSGFPKDVGKIILSKCATAGCHNDQSKDAAAGLSLETWDKMMAGDRNGSVCIPYSHDNSTMFLFSNTFSDLGAQVTPTMPYNSEPLSRDEVTLLRNWIESGAPNADGYVKFSENPNRKKYYVTNQGCDLVCVFDAETQLPMRYISVGHKAQIESPHSVRISPDGQYWYVCFSAGDVLQKYRTSDDSYVGQATLVQGSWNTFVLTPDGTHAFAVDWTANGQIAYVDLNTMTVVQFYQGSGLFVYPHGSAYHNNFLYVTAQNGNFIYKMDVSTPTFPGSPDQISLDGNTPTTNPFSLNPHEITFSPDGSKYFVTCQHSNEVRVMDTNADTLIATIPTGDYPVEMSLSLNAATPYLFVTCMEDTTNFPGTKGSVAVINYNTNTLVTSIHTGYQPHGIAVDDDKGQVVVANRNISLNGPAPHHATSCGGRNGYVTFIDMNTLTLTTRKQEVTVDPYSVGYRR